MGLQLTGTRIGKLDPLTDVEEAIDALMPKIRDIVFEKSSEARDLIRDNWPNPDNSGPQASGRPSESTGLSSKSWSQELKLGIHEITSTLTNDVDYAEYVHFTGGSAGPPGDALIEAEITWDKAQEEMDAEIIALIENL